MTIEDLSIETGALRALGENANHTRRNHVLGVLAGMFAAPAMSFMRAELILVGLISVLTDSPFLIALVPILDKLGVLAPQLLVSSRLEHFPRRRPHFVALTVARSLAYASLVGAMWLLIRDVNALTLAVFFLAYLFVCVCNGTGHVIFMDMIGRLIPSTRVGAFLGMRSLLGGVLAVVCGVLVIQPILARVAMPFSYVVLGAIGTALVAIDMSTWCFCREEPGARAERRTSLRDAIQRGLSWLRTDHNYRSYLWLRIAFRINYLGLVFFIPYGARYLASGNAREIAMLGGLMISTMTLSGVVWGRVADRRGSRTALISAGVLFLTAPILALVAPSLPKAFSIPLPFVTRRMDLPLLVYFLALTAIGAAVRANMIGGQRLLITSAPPAHRPTYVAFLNTVTSPLTLLPLAGAAIASTLGLKALYIGTVAGGALFLVTALRMVSDRPPGVDRYLPGTTMGEDGQNVASASERGRRPT